MYAPDMSKEERTVICGKILIYVEKVVSDVNSQDDEIGLMMMLEAARFAIRGCESLDELEVDDSLLDKYHEVKKLYDDTTDNVVWIK